MAKTTIHSDYIPDNAITSTKIAENSIGAREIATNAITTLYVADDSVTADKLANSINTDIALGVAALPKTGGTLSGNLRIDNSASTAVRLQLNNTGSNDYASIYADTASAYKNLILNPLGGNVGIGTSSPSGTKKLHVYSGNSGASDYGVPGLAIENDTNVSLQLMGGASHQLGITFSDSGATEAGYIYYNTGTQDLTLKVEDDVIFKSGTAETMRIDSSGNVGIDVTPSAHSSTYRALQIGSVGSIFSHASATGDGSTFFGSNIYNNSGWKYITTNEASFIQQKNGEFYFARAASGSAGAAATLSYPFVINSSGKVGIGTDGPSGKLHVEGATSGANLLIDDGTGYGVYVASQNAFNFNYGNNATSTGYINFRGYQDGATQFRNTNIGNGKQGTVAFFDGVNSRLGIGTESPTSKLDVRGVFHVGASASTTPVISRSLAPSGSQGLFLTAGVVNSESTTTPTFADNSSSGASIYLGGNATDQYGGTVAIKAYGAGADGNLTVFENRSGTNTFKENMRITSAGLVAINTTTVASESALNIGAVASAGAQEGGHLVLQSATNGSKAIHIDNYNNASTDFCRFMSGTDTNSASVIGAWDITNTRFGIGTATPAQTLTVAGSAWAQGYYITALQGNSQLTNASTSSGSLACYIGQGLISVSVSDAKAKENFGSVETNECLNKVVSLAEHVKKFDWIDEDWKKEKGRTVGMVAQEIYEDHSEFVHKPENYDDDGWAIRYQEIVPTLTKAIQEQQEQIETLQREVQELKE